MSKKSVAQNKIKTDDAKKVVDPKNINFESITKEELSELVAHDSTQNSAIFGEMNKLFLSLSAELDVVNSKRKHIITLMSIIHKIENPDYTESDECDSDEKTESEKSVEEKVVVPVAKKIIENNDVEKKVVKSIKSVKSVKTVVKKVPDAKTVNKVVEKNDENTTRPIKMVKTVKTPVKGSVKTPKKDSK